MKPLQISRDVLPLAAFKTQASRVFRQLKDEKRPVVVTQNGRPAAVLVPPEEFDRLQEQDRFLLAVHQGLVDSYSGRLVDEESMRAELDEIFSG